MKPCIVHLGSSKTGTTSLQHTLRAKLTDPGFCWLSGDGITGPFDLVNLFAQNPLDYVAQGHYQYSPERLAARRETLLQNLEQGLQAAAKADRTPVLSSEYAYRMSQAEFTAVRDFLTERGFAARVCVYLRPHHDWSESSLQQHIRTRSVPSSLGDYAKRLQAHSIDHLERLTTLHTVFGSDNVDAFVFNVQAFPEGCSVLHFCRHYGIDMNREQVIKSNEALNRNIARLLVAWTLYGKQPPVRLQSLHRDLLVARLQSLEGPRFEIHADLIRDKLAEHESQRADVEHLLGQSFPASFRQRDPATAIRSIEELVDYPKEIMDWLADATGKQPLSPGQGLDVARRVAEQMQSLKLFTNLRLLTKTLRRRANLRRINHQSGI